MSPADELYRTFLCLAAHALVECRLVGELLEGASQLAGADLEVLAVLGNGILAAPEWRGEIHAAHQIINRFLTELRMLPVAYLAGAVPLKDLKYFIV
jgi:hypothetical protein